MMLANKPVLKLEHVSKRFSDRPVVDDISLTLYEGEVACLIGPSGAGKTTLLRIIAGLEKPDTGVIDIPQKKSGFVFQEYQLWSHKTVLENITLGLLKVEKMNRIDAKERGGALLHQFGLNAYANTYPDFLSGGQRQRVAIARALANKPKLLLLDEITSALDSDIISDMQVLITSLSKAGQSMLIATHNYQFAEKIADTIYHLKAGSIVKHTTTDEPIFNLNAQSHTATTNRSWLTDKIRKIS